MYAALRVQVVTLIPLSNNCQILLRFRHFVFLLFKTTFHFYNQVACDESTVKKFDYEFHPASYMTLLEALQVMKNVLGHLINYSKVCEHMSYPVKK